MTRAKVVLIGLIVLALGGVAYVGFEAVGVQGFSAGIAAQSLLVLIVVAWTGSYLFRVVTMTFMEQRRRYREVYTVGVKSWKLDSMRFPKRNNRLCFAVLGLMGMTSRQTHRLIGLIRRRPRHAFHPSAI